MIMPEPREGTEMDAEESTAALRFMVQELEGFNCCDMKCPFKQDTS